ncbi:MAG: Gfo/Idh/MocA family oxidoreductase [Paradevosia shaoguanensis]
MDQLQRFWQGATLPLPVVVVGGGRWGRTWLSVINQAHGSCRDVVIVGHSNPDELRAWLADRGDFNGLQVAESLAEATDLLPAAAAAIVASRPRDHLRDGLSALQHGLHVLVEKPLAASGAMGEALLLAAQDARRDLCIGTEFALLPAFHQCVAALARKGARKATRVHLEWHDPPQEWRHGAAKQRHEEVALLVDLMWHAVSIFQVFAPDALFRVVRAQQNTSGNEGILQLQDEAGALCDLVCSTNAGRRVRMLTIDTGATRASIDFSSDVPVIIIDGQRLPASDELSAFGSTLRLELGAFFLHATGDRTPNFISSGASTLVALQTQLEHLLYS